MASQQSGKQQLQKLKADMQKKLHEQNAFTDVLGKIEAKTGVDRFYLVAGKSLFPHFLFTLFVLCSRLRLKMHRPGDEQLS